MAGADFDSTRTNSYLFQSFIPLISPDLVFLFRYYDFTTKFHFTTMFYAQMFTVLLLRHNIIFSDTLSM